MTLEPDLDSVRMNQISMSKVTQFTVYWPDTHTPHSADRLLYQD